MRRRSRPAHDSRRAARPLAALALLMWAWAWLASAPGAGAEARLAGAVPEANGRVSDAPREIVLVMSEEVSAGAIRLFDGAGTEIVLDAAMTRADDPRVISAAVPPGLGKGTWTVGWNARSAVDGTATSGLYAFRIGPGPAPGAAPMDRDWPAAWAVAARWLTFLGLALAAGAFLLFRLEAPAPLAPSGGRGSATWLGVGTMGATLALLATALEPILASFFPGSGPKLPLAEQFASMPYGYVVRLAASLGLALLLLALLATGKRGRLPGWVDLGGLLLALAALDALGRSSHPTAISLAGAVIETLHQWSSALLAGGALLLAVTWASLSSGADDPLRAARRFGRLALPLLAVAALTGIAAAGIVIPRPTDVLSLPYGQALAAKLVLLLALAAGATLLWRWSRRGEPAGEPRTALLAGAGLGLLGLIAASAMPLLARPGNQTFVSLAQLDLPAAVPLETGEAGRVSLVLQPAANGENAVFLRVADASGAVLPPSRAPMLELELAPLDHPGQPISLSPIPDPNGGFAISTAGLEGAGWWRATTTLVPPVGDPHRVESYLVLPDPNVNGAGPQPDSDPEARAVFDRAMAVLRELRSVRYTQRLSDGNGALFQSINEATEAVDGRPQAYREVTADTEMVIVGDTQWIRPSGAAEWEERAAASLYLPSAWWEVYQPAVGFRLGPVEVVDGEPCRVVTFRLPRADRTAPTWYAWWVGEETGEIRREAMISQRHYMIYTFGDFNEDIRIEPPAERVGPPATPAP